MPQESVDPVVRLLLKSPLTPAQRRSASEAFTGSVDEDDLASKLGSMTIPKEVKRALWDLKYQAPKQAMETSVEPQGNPVGRFLKNAGEMINPVTIGKGMYQMGRHPIDTYDAAVQASGNQFEKSREAYNRGGVSEAIGHAAAGMIPIVGPLAAESGEQIAAGDIAGGLGKAVGILAGPKILKEITKLPLRVPMVTRMLESGAANRVAEVMTPKASTQLARRMAEKAKQIAPQIAKLKGGGWSRHALQEQIIGKLTSAEDALDAAANERFAGSAMETGPIIDALKSKRAAQTAQAVEASSAPRPTISRPSSILDESGQPMRVSEAAPVTPYGRDVVPGPNQPRVSQIDQAMSELQQLGPTTRYEPVRQIRQAYDAPARTVYNPSLVDDFLKKSGEAKGAADVTAALRETLAKADPATAEANASYALYKSASDILDAAEQIDRVKPKVGRMIMGRLTSTILGGQAAGAPGAAAGFVLGPTVEGLLNSGFTTKLKTAQLMQALADATKAGDVGRVESLTYKIMRAAAKVRVPAVGAARQTGLAGQE